MRKLAWVGLALSLVGGAVQTRSSQVAAPKREYPAPRYPKIPKMETVDQLVPYARTILARKQVTADDKIMQPSYGDYIKKGSKVLIAVDHAVDPLVIEAFTKVLREELSCRVDTVVFQAEGKAAGEDPLDEASSMERWVQGGGREGGGDRWLSKVVDGYDFVIGYAVGKKGQRMPFRTRELLASNMAQFPPEINAAINRRAWEILRQAERVRITDPEGTDVRFTWFPEYWAVIEGAHPTIKTRGTSASNNFGAGFIYGKAGASEHPLFSNHLMGVPDGIILEKSDAEGVVAGTTAHQGPFRRIVLAIKNHRIVRVEGGGRYGEAWAAYLDKFKDVQYPVFPSTAKGVGHWIEAAIGTNPKGMRPHNVMEAIGSRDVWSEERKRAGVIHLGFGNALVENAEWARKQRLPGGHYHIHLYFPTYTITTRDGREINLIDKGHLTVLDDPEVRRVAAKYGNPDELLREDWIPAIPGINVPGDYLRDYASDPVGWIQKEHRQAYGSVLDFRPYR